MNCGRCFLVASGIFGFLSVGLGAFAAHALKGKLDEYFMGVFRTAVEYQFYHALALGLVGLLALRYPEGGWRAAGLAFIVGNVVFAGSLFLLVATKAKGWGAVTPIGGVSYLVGWALFALAAFRVKAG